MKNKIEQLKRDIAFTKKKMDCKIQNAMLKGETFDVREIQEEIFLMKIELADLTSTARKL